MPLRDKKNERNELNCSRKKTVRAGCWLLNPSIFETKVQISDFFHCSLHGKVNNFGIEQSVIFKHTRLNQFHRTKIPKFIPR